jgi:multidrug efflux system outer membrane protein
MKLNYRYSAVVAIAAAVSILASCTVSKDVAAPDMNLPQTFRNTAADADTTSVADLPWQTFFGDDKLKTLINEALLHNNDLLAALKNIDAAESAFKQAKLGNIPNVDVAATASDARPSDHSLDNIEVAEILHQSYLTDYTVAASLSWEADIWGKIRSKKAEALAGYLSSAAAKKALQTRIIDDLAKGYYNLLMLDTQLGIARRNMALADSSLILAQVQYRAGAATSVAVQQASAQKLTAAAYIPQFEQEIALQETAIGLLTGKFSADVDRTGSVDAIAIPEKIASGLPAAVLGQRPDVQQAELELVRENAEVGYAKAAMYPSLTISAQGGVDAIKASNWFNIPASLFGIVAGSIAEPLFEQKRLSTAYKIAKDKRDNTVFAFRQSVLNAYGEVSDELVQLDKLKARQEIILERTDALQSANKNTMVLFKTGSASYLDVIVAERGLLESELELASIKKERLNAYVDLYRSLGGGWR